MRIFTHEVDDVNRCEYHHYRPSIRTIYLRSEATLHKWNWKSRRLTYDLLEVPQVEAHEWRQWSEDDSHLMWLGPCGFYSTSTVGLLLLFSGEERRVVSASGAAPETANYKLHKKIISSRKKKANLDSLSSLAVLIFLECFNLGCKG